MQLTDDEENPQEPQVVEVPIDGVLDLHTFRPRDLKDLLPTYLGVCRERGILQVRIIHGKGSGALRRTVHSILGRLPSVASYTQAGEEAGGWGATIVTLRPSGGSGLLT
ncbi:MAG TPA: Smr/MutS family protein [Thermodesulfovibrionales bacterium]|nr:Smr/MutS family protein [Thermodesulfovibrionales bacterium]